jgi:hypothetical protein
VIKIDYEDGQGSGDILWRLGYQGDFTLTNGQSSDWVFAQHYPTFVSPNSTGVFNLEVSTMATTVSSMPTGISAAFPTSQFATAAFPLTKLMNRAKLQPYCGSTTLLLFSQTGEEVPSNWTTPMWFLA